MDDAVVQNIVSTQSQMLQQLQSMQAQQSMQGSMMNMAGGMMGMGGSMMGMGAMPYSVFSTPYASGPLAYAPPSHVGGGLAGQMWSNFWNSSPTTQSKEMQLEMMAQQNRSLQESLLSGASTAVNGMATLGSFMMPGGMLLSLGAGALVGGTVAAGTKWMVDGAHQAMNYEDIIRQKGYLAVNPFQSSGEMGTIGFSRTDQQDMAKFMRHLAPDKMLEDSDLQRILNGSFDNQLLRNVDDVDKFKKKFSSIVDTVKQITLTMNQTIEEATAFMGEMQRRGILDKDMSMYASQFKIASSMAGMNPQMGAQMILQTSDSITQGTAINAGTVAQTVSNNMSLSSLLYNQSATLNPEVHQYIANMGGPGQFGATAEQTIRQFISANGSSKLLGLLGSAFQPNEPGSSDFVINDGIMNDLLSGKYTPQQLMARSQAATSGFSSTQLAALSQQAATRFQNYANTTQEYQLINLMKQSMQATTPGLDDATALKVMGVAPDYEMAQALAAQLKIGTDKSVLASLDAQKVKEAADAFAISQTPSVAQQVKFGVARLRTSVGDLGQNFSDSASDALYGLQGWMSGLGDRSNMAAMGGKQYDLTRSALSRDFGPQAFDALNKNFRDMQALTGNKAVGFDATVYSAAMSKPVNLDDAFALAHQLNSQMTHGQFNTFRDAISSGSATPADIAQLNDMLNDPNITGDERDRIQYLIRKGTGSEGFFRNMWDLGNEKGSHLMDVADVFGIGSKLNVLFSKNLTADQKNLAMKQTLGLTHGTSTLKTLEQQGKDLDGLYHDANQKLAKALVGVDSDRREKLQAYVQAGRSDLVQQMMGGSAGQTIMDLTNTFDKLNQQDSEMSSATNAYKSMVQDAEAMAKGAQQLQNVIGQTGVLNKKDVSNLFAATSSSANKVLKELKGKNMSADDAAMAIAQLEDSVSSGFRAMTPSKLDAFATEFIKQNPNLGIHKEQLFTDGTNKIDASKFADAYLRFVSVQNSDTNAQAGNDLKSSKDKADKQAVEMKQTLDGHIQTMYEMLNTFQEETKMMRDTLSGYGVRLPSKTTLATSSR